MIVIVRMAPAAPGLREIPSAAADVARPRAEARHIELIVEEAPGTPPVAVDPARFARVLGKYVRDEGVLAARPRRAAGIRFEHRE